LKLAAIIRDGNALAFLPIEGILDLSDQA